MQISSKMVKNTFKGLRGYTKDISIWIQKNRIFAPKGDNFELFQRYKHFKSQADFLVNFIPYRKVTNMSVIIKICNEKPLNFVYPRAALKTKTLLKWRKRKQIDNLVAEH